MRSKKNAAKEGSAASCALVPERAQLRSSWKNGMEMMREAARENAASVHQSVVNGSNCKKLFVSDIENRACADSVSNDLVSNEAGRKSPADAGANSAPGNVPYGIVERHAKGLSNSAGGSKTTGGGDCGSTAGDQPAGFGRSSNTATGNAGGVNRAIKVMICNGKGVGVGTERGNLLLATLVSFAEANAVGAVLLNEFQYDKETADRCAVAPAQIPGGDGDDDSCVEDAVGTSADIVGEPWLCWGDRHVLITSTQQIGVGVVLLGNLLREFEFLSDRRPISELVVLGQRAMRVVLGATYLVPIYGPAGASRALYNQFLQSVLSTQGGLLPCDKWKLGIIAGDWNVDIGVDCQVDGVVGPYTSQSSSSGAKWFCDWMLNNNFVLTTSMHDRLDRKTHGPSELDMYVNKPRDRHRAVGFRTVQQEEFEALRPPLGVFEFDHKCVLSEWDVRSFEEVCERSRERTGDVKVFKNDLAPAESQLFNNMFANCVETLEDVVMVVGAHLENMQEKIEPTPPEGVSDEASSTYHKDLRAVYEFIKENGRKRRKKCVEGAPTAEQFAAKYAEVGNSPAPDSDVDVASVLREEDIQPFCQEQVLIFDRELELGEVKAAIRDEGVRPKAKDIYGMSMRVFGYLTEPNLERLTRILNDAVRSGSFANEPITTAHKCSELFKNVGSHRDSGNYRFLTISPSCCKLVERIYTTRLTRMVEECGAIHPDTQFGFRAGLGTSYSLLMMSRLVEDCAELMGMEEFAEVFSCFFDLRKAFPSLDSRSVDRAMDLLGLSATRGWAALRASHRNARFHFRDAKSFANAHGLREGAVSSPLLFAIVFGLAMRRFEKEAGGGGGAVVHAAGGGFPEHSPSFGDTRECFETAARAALAIHCQKSGVHDGQARGNAEQDHPDVESGRLCATTTRACLLYASESRGHTAPEVNRYVRTDNEVVLKICGRKRWQLRQFHQSMGDIRRGLELPPLRVVLFYRKASFFGHVARAPPESNYAIVREALFGRFFPARVPGSNGALVDEAAYTCSARSVVPTAAGASATVAGNVVQWLESGCGIARELIPALLSREPQVKRLYHCLTREAYVRDCVSDWTTGREAAGEIAQKKAALMAKCDVDNEGLNTIEHIYAANTCAICDAPGFYAEMASGAICLPVSEKARARAKRAFAQHVAAAHAGGVECAAVANMVKRGEAWFAQKKRDVEEELLLQHAGVFRKLKNCGPVPQKKQREEDDPCANRNKRKKRTDQYYCEQCEVSFCTSVQSMCRHAQAHEMGDAIIWFKIRSGANEGRLRPEQHWMCEATGRYSGGTDSYCHQIHIPADWEGTPSRIVCRHCQRAGYQFEASWPLKRRLAAVRALRAHEEFCGAAE
eukprot:gene191-330_t